MATVVAAASASGGPKPDVYTNANPPGSFLEWSLHLGGGGSDHGYGIATDGAGNAYVTGSTDSAGWASGGFDTAYHGGGDAFIAKISPSGATVWSAYLGGPGNDGGNAISVDAAGDVYVAGETESSGWVSGGFDTTYHGGNDAFVAKVTSSGAFLWSTYLGGSGNDSGNGIAVDGAGGVYVTGITSSSAWASGGFDAAYNGGQDAFVAKLSSAGALLWSTYLGGSNYDAGYGIAVDGLNGVYATGETWSSGWASGGFDPTFNGGYGDAFVAKVTSAGAHVWSTYLGGDSLDWGESVAVDGSGGVCVTGVSYSAGWTSGSLGAAYNGGGDAFVARLSSSGALAWSTYLGGGQYDWGGGIVARAQGDFCVTGETRSGDWVSGGFDTAWDGHNEAFVAALLPDGLPLWSSYLGESGISCGYGVTLGPMGELFVTGEAGPSFTTTSAFVAKIQDGFGSLRAMIEPQGARDAGGQWRRAGEASWRDSGDTESDVPVGPVVVEFKDIAGWDTPLAQGVTVYRGQTASGAGLYARQTGSLLVTISPQHAIDLGAGWRRAGDSTWRNSGETESGIPVDPYVVEFNSIPYWDAPTTQSVTIRKNLTAIATGTYISQCHPQAPPPPFNAREFYDVRYRGNGSVNEDLLLEGRIVIAGNTQGTLSIKRLKGRTETPMLISIESSGTLNRVYSEAPVDCVSVEGELARYTGKASYVRNLEAGSLGLVKMAGRSTTGSLEYVTIRSTQESRRTADARLTGLALQRLSAPGQKAAAHVSTKKSRKGIHPGAVGFRPGCGEDSGIEARELKLLMVRGGAIQARSIRADRGRSTRIMAKALNLSGRRYGADVEVQEVALGVAKATVVALGGNIPMGAYAVDGAFLQFAARSKRFPDGAYGGFIGSQSADAAPLSYGALLAGGGVAQGVDVASGAGGQPYAIGLIRGDAGIYGTFHTVPGACPGQGKIRRMQTLSPGDRRLPAGVAHPAIEGAIFISPHVKPPVLVGDTTAIDEGRLKINDCGATGP